MLTRTGRPCSRHCTPRLTLSPYFRRRAARERGHGRAVQLPNARHLHAAHVLVQHADRNTAPDAAANAARHADDDAARHAAGHATRHAEVDATRHADAVSSTTRIRYEVNIYSGRSGQQRTTAPDSLILRQIEFQIVNQRTTNSCCCFISPSVSRSSTVVRVRTTISCCCFISPTVSSAVWLCLLLMIKFLMV